jgi:hypothetical protein
VSTTPSVRLVPLSVETNYDRFFFSIVYRKKTLFTICFIGFFFLKAQYFVELGFICIFNFSIIIDTNHHNDGYASTNDCDVRII